MLIPVYVHVLLATVLAVLKHACKLKSKYSVVFSTCFCNICPPGGVNHNKADA